MRDTYSLYEAKAKLSAIIRQVREGRHVLVTVHGEPVAEIRPVVPEANDLAALVKERSRSASKIVTVPYDRAYEPGFEDMPRRVPDIAKIGALIGYEPRVELDETLDRVITYFRER